jgi:putative addiction module component (TIGR02574 family)
MHGTKDIIQEATALPVEERVIVIDSLLRTLNHPNPDIDEEWVAVAKRRLTELRSGRVRPVPGDHVFARIKERFAR